MNSQAIRILDKIRGSNGVENWQLSEIALKYTSCISALRKRGYNIVAERVYHNGKATGTYKYYLKEKPQTLNQQPDRNSWKSISWLDKNDM